MRIHLDTDLGGDPDDVCALAMLLGKPEIELTGITTTIDPGGRRAGMVAHCLGLARRAGIPVAAGAEVSSTSLLRADPYMDDERMWPRTVVDLPSPPGAALDLLSQSIEQGATILAIGPYTNLALLEIVRPGSLARVPVVVMGGWVKPPDGGLPEWCPDMDWNVQWDIRAAEIVAAAATDLTLVTLPATMKAHLRTADLPRLRAAGPLGELIARQAEAYGGNRGMSDLGQSYSGLPDDLLNFHYDPVAVAVAVGWHGATVKEMSLKPIMHGETLRFQPDADGLAIHVVTDIDGQGFTEVWLSAVEATGRH